MAVTFRIGRLGVPVIAEFTSPEPRTLTMRIIDGEGSGSVVETHATPNGSGPDGRPRSTVIEAVIAHSDRPGFARALRAQSVIVPFMRQAASRLWRDDLEYAERLAGGEPPGRRTVRRSFSGRRTGPHRQIRSLQQRYPVPRPRTDRPGQGRGGTHIAPVGPTMSITSPMRCRGRLAVDERAEHRAYLVLHGAVGRAGLGSGIAVGRSAHRGSPRRVPGGRAGAPRPRWASPGRGMAAEGVGPHTGPGLLTQRAPGQQDTADRVEQAARRTRDASGVSVWCTADFCGAPRRLDCLHHRAGRPVPPGPHSHRRGEPAEPRPKRGARQRRRSSHVEVRLEKCTCGRAVDEDEVNAGVPPGARDGSTEGHLSG